MLNNEKTGSCLCGQIQFVVQGDFESFFLCHCKHCQKDTGSSYAANLFSASSKLLWTSGESSVKTFNLPLTKHVKSFCGDCGSALPSMQDDGKLLVVPAGSLDVPLPIRPSAHIFFASKAAWEEDLNSVHVFAKLPN